MKPEIIGKSENIQKVIDLIENVADTGLNTVIVGETGVGKELVAQSLYYHSPRRNRPFVKVNCAALPDGLLESELFGYERGAFTGADRKTRGKFELAHRGVLFLDEIGDMSLPLQSKLLHVLQSGEFNPLGSEKMVTTDTWIIAATNHDLEQDIQSMNFREDLFYRLNIIKIQILPLRERPEDIGDLIDYFYDQYSQVHKKHRIPYPSTEIMRKLTGYSWPGNVRQLQNIIQKAMVLGSWEDALRDFQQPGRSNPSPALSTTALPGGGNGFHGAANINFNDLENVSLKRFTKEAVDRVERQIISQILAHTNWNRTKASKILKISYKTLLYKISYLNISPSNHDNPNTGEGRK